MRGRVARRVLLCRGEHRLGIGAQPGGLVEERIAPALGVGQQLRCLFVDLGEDLVAHAARLVDDCGALALRLGQQTPGLLFDLGEHLGLDALGDDPGLVHHPRGIGEEPVALGEGLVAYTRCVGISPAGLDLFLARSAGATRLARLTRLTCSVVGLGAHPSRMTPCLARRLDARARTRRCWRPHRVAPGRCGSCPRRSCRPSAVLRTAATTRTAIEPEGPRRRGVASARWPAWEGWICVGSRVGCADASSSDRRSSPHWYSSPASATPASAQAPTGTVTIVHAFRGLVADVYLDGKLALQGFEPERTTAPLQIPAGDHAVAVREAKADPNSAPAVAGTLKVTAGANISAVVHMAQDGKPTMTQFDNDVNRVAPGTARLIVRHTAAAPAVNVIVDGTPLAANLVNPNQSPARDLPAAAHQVTVDAAGGGTAVVPPDSITLADGTAQILYLIGSTSDNSVGWLTQTVQGLTSAPAGVPTGTDGLAQPARFPITVFMVLLALAVMTAPALRLRRRGHVAERANR